MSQLKITNAGLTYKDLVFAGAETQNITHFIFANIAGLNEGDVIDPNMAIPTNDIVHTQPIDRVSALDGNAVVMSAVLGYDVGNFEFNWFGAVATKADNSQVLIAVVQTALQTKTKTVGPSVGNYSVKSIVWRSQNIADNLNVTLSALPWQLNESAFVSKTDFEAHNHDAEYLAITAQAQSAKTADKLGELLPSDFAQTDHNHGNIRVIDRSYSVSNTVIENLKNIDGNFFGGTALRVRGITTGTGTFNTDSEAIFWHDGVTWKVNQVSGIQSSNCVEFVIFNGKPSVKTAHPNKYLARVHHEEYIHSQKASGAYFGLGQQLSVVNGHFKHNGYRVFTEDYLPTASELGITPETIGAISVSSGGNIAIETTTYGLTAYPTATKTTPSSGWARAHRFTSGADATKFGTLGALGSGDSIGYMFMNANTEHATGYSELDAFRVYPDRAAWGTNTIYHEGNLTPATIDALPTSGGVITGDTRVDLHTTLMFGPDSIGNYGNIWHDEDDFNIQTNKRNLSLDGQAAIIFKANGSTQCHVNSTGLKFNDNKQLRLGSSNDTRMYHDGSNTRIEQYTGNLYFNSYGNGNDISFFARNTSGVSKKALEISADENVRPVLYYNGISKFETTNTGAALTGELTQDGIPTPTQSKSNSYYTNLTSTLTVGKSSFGSNPRLLLWVVNDGTIEIDGSTFNEGDVIEIQNTNPAGLLTIKNPDGVLLAPDGVNYGSTSHEMTISKACLIRVAFYTNNKAMVNFS